jgi:hypothetical protein
VLCDGTNSTPDLRDRFVVGAGSTYAVNATGGSANAIVVSHTHAATVTDPGHFHSLTGSLQSLGAATAVTTFVQIGTTNTSTEVTNITVTNASTGVSATNANLPPYFALAYIMKT